MSQWKHKYKYLCDKLLVYFFFIKSCTYPEKGKHAFLTMDMHAQIGLTFPSTHARVYHLVSRSVSSK